MQVGLGYGWLTRIRDPGYEPLFYDKDPNIRYPYLISEAPHMELHAWKWGGAMGCTPGLHLGFGMVSR